MEDSIIHLPDTRSTRLRAILVNAADPRVLGVWLKAQEMHSGSLFDTASLDDLVREARKIALNTIAPYEMLLNSYTKLPESEFNRLYRAVQNGLLDAKDVCTRTRDTVTSTENALRLSLRDSFDKITQYPSFWFVPRSEDIARILAAAQHVHDSRVEKRLKRASDPMTIVDVGNGYGDLSALILATARKKGMRIKCHVTSPRFHVIEEQRDIYASTKHLSFFCESRLDMLLRVWNGFPHIRSEISAFAQFITRSRECLDDLHTLGQVFVADFAKHNISAKDADSYASILENDFGVVFPPDFTVRSGTIHQLFVRGVQFTQCMSLLKFMSNKYSEAFKKRLLGLETCLAEARGCGADMVLQTWMSPGTDSTSYVRLVGAGAIGYIFDYHGKTGVQCGAEYTNPLSFDTLHSYDPGESYVPICAWKGVSVKEVAENDDSHEDIFATFLQRNRSAGLQVKKGSYPPNPVFLLQGSKKLFEGKRMFVAVNSAENPRMFGWEKVLLHKERLHVPMSPLFTLSDYSLQNIKRVLGE